MSFMSFYEFQKKSVDTMEYLIKLRRYLLKREPILSDEIIEISKKLNEVLKKDTIEDISVKFSFLNNSGSMKNSIIYQIFNILNEEKKDKEIFIKMLENLIYKKNIDEAIKDEENFQSFVKLIEKMIDKIELDIEEEKKKELNSIINVL